MQQQPALQPYAPLTGNGAALHAPGPMGHPALVWFDAVRDLLIATGLAPTPEVYGLLWLYVTAADPALVRDVDRERSEGRLDEAAVARLRRDHLGEIAASELQALVADGRDQASRLQQGLAASRHELGQHGGVLDAADVAIGATRSAERLGEQIALLRQANASLMAANRRLDAELDSAQAETARLLERLDSAERRARTDPLTGLPNRRGLHHALAAALASDPDQPLAVAIIDIDHFKRINDRWGHAIGDEVLRCIGGHLAAHAARLGAGAMAGRHGGEEFLLLLPGLTVQEGCAAVDRARAQLARQVIRRASDGASLGHISFSGGVAGRRPNDNADSLIDRADAALYVAKQKGRDRILPELPD